MGCNVEDTITRYNDKIQEKITVKFLLTILLLDQVIRIKEIEMIIKGKIS